MKVVQKYFFATTLDLVAFLDIKMKGFSLQFALEYFSKVFG